jgi:predicted RNA-binding Zn-ribbon protein involved in translation (DUF1610 family)
MPTLSQHACFNYRKVFKKPHEYLCGASRQLTLYKCPQCGNDMVFMGYKFRAPAMNNTDEWRRIERALKESQDYGIPTMRKQKPKPKLEPALRIALGIYGKRRSKNA